MPQGPTSRGCEACRAQKKKCDLTQPTCSRCQKLRVTCVGCGQKRFAFSTRTGKVVLLSRDRRSASLRPAPTPSNETTCLQQAVMGRLQASNDIRYSIRFRYGNVLMDLPKRVGSNKALDAAVAALLARHAETSRRQDQSDPDALAVIEYNRALAAVRTTLADPHEASTCETLCAVMLLTFCQARFDDQFTFFWSPHGQGMLHLLRMRNFPTGGDFFETCLFGTLYATVLFQSFANPVVRLNPQEYRRIKEAFIKAAPSAQDVRQWILTVQVSELMAKVRNAIASGECLDAMVVEAEELHISMQTVLATIYDRLEGIEAESSTQPPSCRVHAIYQRVYGVTLGSMATLLCLQRRLSPHNSTLDVVAANLCNEVLRICHRARAYRPVGAVWTVHALICAWCSTQDSVLRAKLEEALIDYQRDAMGPKAEVRMDQLRLLERRFSLSE